ncbi:lysylphosphatidylglycerol synthase transmembrane domain-containing protein [Arcicella aquatica]|uniref:Lysylphosphatidylglycerol synthase transmembrane domain-containing protein n=1 Tax=Arcicella aquatica TaxID=217141 RepID=A0ABU5QR37_9BACT|nr:lysylphosphatidylglycerol synthase transmembrane domain-containing protein [Arcicella aquatica]MEA5259289.1 lysylphosphatidylglycerol synthase transmembrane domain-containing protein [Arcicella aquatica]
MKKILQYTISLVLAGGLLWFVFKDISLSEMLDEFRKADYKWLMLSAILSIIAHVSRALRWKMLMKPLGYQPSTFNTTLAVFIGYFANYVIPRMGEVSRCGSLKKTDDIPFEKSFGTVLTERIFDVVSLLIVLSLNLILEFDKLQHFFMEQFASKIYLIVGLLAFLAVAGIIGIYLFRKYQQRLSDVPVLGKIVGFLNGLLDGLMSIKKIEKPFLFIFLSANIWVMYWLSAYVLFFAIPETTHLGLLAGLTVLTMGSFGMAAPTQGGIGPFHFLVGNALVLYGLPQKDGIILATFIHGSQMVTLLALGALSFLITLFIKPKTDDTRQSSNP